MPGFPRHRADDELDLISAERDKFGNPQTVPVGDQDHGAVAMLVPARSLTLSWGAVAQPRLSRAGAYDFSPMMADFASVSILCFKAARSSLLR